MTEPSGSQKLRAGFWIVTGSAIVLFLVVRGAVTYRTVRAEEQATVYEFEANGKRFTGVTDGEQGSWSEGDTLTVKFNSENPTENRAAGDRGPLGDYLVMLLFGGVFGVAMIRYGYSTGPSARPILAPKNPARPALPVSPALLRLNSEGNVKKCPFCAEEIQDQAILCDGPWLTWSRSHAK